MQRPAGHQAGAGGGLHPLEAERSQTVGAPPSSGSGGTAVFRRLETRVDRRPTDCQRGATTQPLPGSASRSQRSRPSRRRRRRPRQPKGARRERRRGPQPSDANSARGASSSRDVAVPQGCLASAMVRRCLRRLAAVLTGSAVAPLQQQVEDLLMRMDPLGVGGGPAFCRAPRGPEPRQSFRC